MSAAAPPPRPRDRGGDLAGAALLLLLLGIGIAWGAVVRLPLTGEDYAVLARLRAGGLGLEHVFRPLAEAVLGGVHAVVGIEHPGAYHVLALGLHFASTFVVFRIATALLGSRAAGIACAALFGFSAAATDALAWVAALNRPLASFGALVALDGLLALERRPRAAAVQVAAGLAWQLGSNEEAYGTALFACAWLAALAARRRESRRLALGLALGILLAFGAHALVLDARLEGPGASAISSGAGQVAGSVMRRAALIAEGWGLPGAFGLALPGVGALVLLVAGRRRAAAFGALAWACALVPFAFSDAVPYRAYPSIAPTALLAGGGLVALASGLRLGPSAALRRGAAAATVAVLAVAGSRGVRGQRLELWREAVSEVEACRAPLAALARAHPESPPVCANLETTTIGLLLYLWPGTTEADLTDLGFLDAASGYVAPSQSPPGPWFGRRCEGSYGVIDPEPYFRERPELAPWRLHARARPVRSLRDALRRMADGSVDLAREALVEAPPEAVRALADAPEDDAGELRVLEELALDAVRPGASMRVLVRAPRPVLLVVQAGFLYQPLYRIAPDQALFSDVRERRVIRLRARSNGTDLPTFAANGFGSAVLVPSGEHSVELDWSIARPEELR